MTMEKRAFHPCIYCSNPVSPERYENGNRTCDGPCVSRLATREEIEARTVVCEDGSIRIDLFTCYQCNCPMSPRADGKVGDMCYGCTVVGTKLKCMNKMHKGDVLVPARWAGYHAVYHEKGKLHGQFSKVMMCLKCAHEHRHITWEEHESRLAKNGAPMLVNRQTGELFAEGTTEDLVLTSTPWDTVGGKRNAWKPGVMAAGVGHSVFFNPTRFMPISGQYVGYGEKRKELWVLMCDRLSSIVDDKPQTYVGSIVHMGVTGIIRDIYRPEIGISRRMMPTLPGMTFSPEMTRTLKGERRQVMQVSDIGWCFAGVAGVDEREKKHKIHFSRYEEHKTHFPGHSLSDWRDYQLKGFSHR